MVRIRRIDTDALFTTENTETTEEDEGGVAGLQSSRLQSAGPAPFSGLLSLIFGLVTTFFKACGLVRHETCRIQQPTRGVGW
jgi:hypothetical protein